MKTKYFMLLLVMICLILVGSRFIFTNNKESMTENKDFAVEWLIEPVLFNISGFYSGFAWIQKKDREAWSLIDKEGNVIIHEFQADDIDAMGYPREMSQDLTGFNNLIKKRYRHGFVNLSGDVVIPAIYNDISFFSEGLAAVKQGNFWGAIDHTGAVVIPFVYENLFFFQQGLAAAQKDGKWGYIDKRGQTVIDFVFDEGFPGGYHLEGRYPVRINGKTGLMDKERNWVLEAAYERIYSTMEDLTGAQQDGKVGFVDREGRVVINFQYEGLSETGPLGVYYVFSEGLAVVLLPGSNVKNPLVGVINKKGELLFKLPGWPRGRYNEGFLLVSLYSDGSLGLVDKTGKWISLPDVQKIAPLVSDGILAVRIPVESRSDYAGKYGYLKVKAKR